LIRFLLLADLGKLFEERPRFVVGIDFRLVPFVDDIQLTHVFLNRQRFDRENHRRLVARNVMLVPDALADVERVAGFPLDALLVENALSLAAQDDDDRFIVLVRHRMRMRRINVAIDFDDAVLKTELLRNQWTHPHAVLRFPFDLYIFAFDRFSSRFAARHVCLDPFRSRFE